MSPLPSSAIVKLNDAFRRTFIGGRVLLTQGVSSLPIADVLAVQRLVQTFDAFSDENDPHGEHDFGAFEHTGVSYFWKIDYYAPTLDAGSDDPADPTRTTRVLTIMRADEY